MFKISKTTCQMYVSQQEPSEVKPTKFEKNLAQNDRRVETQLLNKATMMGSSGADSFNFLMKSLWVNSSDTKHNRLRELVQTRKAACKSCDKT